MSARTITVILLFVAVAALNTMRRYFKISAYSDSPGYPTVQVRWLVKGIPRGDYSL